MDGPDLHNFTCLEIQRGVLYKKFIGHGVLEDIGFDFLVVLDLSDFDEFQQHVEVEVFRIDVLRVETEPVHVNHCFKKLRDRFLK